MAKTPSTYYRLWTQLSVITIFLGLSISTGFSQSLNPSTPTKEYIRIDGQIVATENWVGLARIAVGYDSTLWGLTGTGNIYQYTPGQGWTPIPGNLAQLVIGNSSSVWGLSSGGYSYRYVNGTFQYVPGQLAQIAVGSDGDAWGLNGATSIYHFNGSGWSQIPGNLVRIAVGNAGAVYGINSGGGIFHFNTSTQTFQPFTTGTLAQIAVGADGDVWGINSQGTVYHYYGGWVQMALGYSQISVGQDSNAWGIDNSGNIWLLFTNPNIPINEGSGYSFVGAATTTTFAVHGNQIVQYVNGTWNPLPEMLAWFRKELQNLQLFRLAA